MSNQATRKDAPRTKRFAGAGSLTLEHRRFVMQLHSSLVQTSKIMGVSQTTLDELISGCGNLRAATLDRARLRIAELQTQKAIE